MKGLERKGRRKRKGTVIVEFALTVPFLFIVVFGVIDFSRAYSQLNAINSGLREAARTASVMKDDAFKTVGAFNISQSTVRKKVLMTAAVFGYNSVDTNRVTLLVEPNVTNAEFVTVRVTAHPVPLPVLGKFLGLSPLTVTRSIRYRWERTGAS